MEAGRQEIATCKPEQLREDSRQYAAPGVLTARAQSIANMKAQGSQWEKSKILPPHWSLGDIYAYQRHFAQIKSVIYSALAAVSEKEAFVAGQCKV